LDFFKQPGGAHPDSRVKKVGNVSFAALQPFSA